MLRNFKREHSLKFILFNLVPSDFFPKKVDLSVCRGQLVRVNIFVIAIEFVQLLGKVLRSVVHVYLHLVLVLVVNSESEDETYLLLRADLGNG